MSNPTSYNIAPMTVSVSSFSVTSVIVRNGSAIVNVELLDSGSMVRQRSFQLDGEDFVSWANNSDWLRDWVASKLGATLS